MRKGRDDWLLDLWMKKILPSLRKILVDLIGSEYSSSLVREGTSEESATAIVRIESPQVPSKSTRNCILQRLDKSCGVVLADSGIEVRFSPGSLELLAGSIRRRISQRNEAATDDKRELPFYTRFWKYPGMGASIGLLCTEEEFATLGCYVEVDKQKFILTVDHFIEKSYRKLRSGIEDKATLTSPALAKVNKMKEELGHLLSSVEGEMHAAILEQFGDRELLPEDLDDPPEEFSKVWRKHSFISDIIEELEKDENEFRIGSLAHKCKSNSMAPLCAEHSTLAAELGTHPGLGGEMCHRMDWALFSVDERAGDNRHRYRYNPDDGTTDYFPEDIEHGEGKICRDTCIVDSNEKVYFVGQTSGRLTGEINGALREVFYKGRSTLEHHIIISAEQKKKGKEYGGDSGAAVLRVSDNNLVGIIWCCINEDPIFTPIRTTFADVKKTLDADDVCLPKVQEDHVPPDNICLISGSQSEVKPQRPFKPSDFELPELTEEATKKHNRLRKAKILERLNSGRKDISKIANDTISIIVTKEGASSPVPSLSYSPSPSPTPTPVSPSPSDGDLTATINTANDPIVVNPGNIDATSVTRADKDGNAIECDEFDRYFKQGLDVKHKLSISYLLTNGNQSKAKRNSYPQQDQVYRLPAIHGEPVQHNSSSKHPPLSSILDVEKVAALRMTLRAVSHQLQYNRLPRHSSTWPSKLAIPGTS